MTIASARFRETAAHRRRRLAALAGHGSSRRRPSIRNSSCGVLRGAMDRGMICGDRKKPAQATTTN